MNKTRTAHINGIIARFIERTGQTATLYPRKGIVSINGHKQMTVEEATTYMLQAPARGSHTK